MGICCLRRYLPLPSRSKLEKNLDPKGKSLAELLNDLSHELTALVHQEFEPARAEVTVKGKRLGAGAGLLGGAAVVAFLGLGRGGGVCYCGSVQRHPGLVLCALVVGVVLLAIAVVLGLMGKAAVQRSHPADPGGGRTKYEGSRGMDQDTGEIREAIDQTRDDIGQTLQAIGHKADIKARASEMVAEKRDAVKESTAEVKAKLSLVAQRVEERVPEAAQPAVSSTVEWAKSTTQPARGGLTATSWRYQLDWPRRRWYWCPDGAAVEGKALIRPPRRPLRIPESNRARP